MKLLVQIENGKRREAFALDFQTEAAIPSGLGLRMMSWLASAISSVGVSGVCKSFAVSVHNLDSECEHEVVDAGAS